MSYVVDTVNKIHELQLKVVADGQDAVIDLLRKATEYADRTAVPEPLGKLVEPIEAVVGSPAELARAFAEVNREWAQAWLDFQTKVAEALTPATEPVRGTGA